MRETTRNRRSLTSKQPKENLLRTKTQTKEPGQPNIATNQFPNHSNKVTAEAIDVLSFVGFKL